MPLFPKQQEFVKAFNSKKFIYLLYGGAWSGGKSLLQIGMLNDLCLQYPDTRYAIVRKNLTTIKRTSVKTFQKILKMNNDEQYLKDFNRTDWIATYRNGSEILFVEADASKDPDFNKLKGLEVTGVLVEEANEIEQQAYSILHGRKGRWNNDKLGGYDFILLNCNPSQGWVKEMFYDPWASNELKAPYYFLQSLPHDNPYNTKQYLVSLEDLPENEYKRYVKGYWDYASDEGQLVNSEWLKDNELERVLLDEFVVRPFDRVVLGIDPARSGKDRTLFSYICNGKFFKFEEIASDDTVYTAGIALERSEEYHIQAQDVIVDVIGVGAGVVDTLKNKKRIPTSFGGGDIPQTELEYFKFKNKRAEGYWLLREALRKGELEFAESPEFKKQMLATKYDTKEKYIQIIPKEEIKKKLNGKSPDHADAAMMAFYQYQAQPGSALKDIKIARKTFTGALKY